MKAQPFKLARQTETHLANFRIVSYRIIEGDGRRYYYVYNVSAYIPRQRLHVAYTFTIKGIVC